MSQRQVLPIHAQLSMRCPSLCPMQCQVGQLLANSVVVTLTDRPAARTSRVVIHGGTPGCEFTCTQACN